MKYPSSILSILCLVAIALGHPIPMVPAMPALDGTIGEPPTYSHLERAASSQTPVHQFHAPLPAPNDSANHSMIYTGPARGAEVRRGTGIGHEAARVPLEDALDSLEPHDVWQNFYNITQVPRPSGQMEQIRAFLVDFGHGLGLETSVDQVGNALHSR